MSNGVSNERDMMERTAKQKQTVLIPSHCALLRVAHGENYVKIKMAGTRNNRTIILHSPS